jgi:hypothetical protein
MYIRYSDSCNCVYSDKGQEGGRRWQLNVLQKISCFFAFNGFNGDNHNMDLKKHKKRIAQISLDNPLSFILGENLFRFFLFAHCK